MQTNNGTDATVPRFLGEVLREMRTSCSLTGRQLADAAQLSHTQVSRIETGATAAPSEETLRRLAHALNFNHRPLMILAGHLTGEDARAELVALIDKHQEMFESWEGSIGMTLGQARSVLAEPSSSFAQLAEVAKEVALWANAEEELGPDGAGDDRSEPDRRKRQLLDIWRLLDGSRRGELVTYGEALRQLQTMEFAAQHRRLILEGSPPPSTTAAAVPFSEADLRRRGFEGFVRIRELRTGVSGVPISPGVYIVVRASADSPEFLLENVGGHYKDRNPSVEAEQLKAAWVASHTLYIGKADAKRTPLRTRLNDLAKFASGIPAAHWGGRMLWQLADHEQLLVCWLETSNPYDVERDLVDEFVDQHDALPFANIQRPGGQR